MATLVLASAASMMSTDLYTPSLPHLPAVFNTTERAVQLTISLNVLAFGIAQLFFGPLSDRFGRRPVILCGLVGFTAMSAACALASTIDALIAFRILQGIMGSVEAVVGLAIVRDLFAEVERIKVLAIWGMAVALAPAAAPILGGYIHVYLGWQANFGLVAGVAVVVTLLIFARLPESTRPNRQALAWSTLKVSLTSLVTSRIYMGNALLLGTSLGAIFVFITGGPFVLITYYGVATEQFGYFQAAIVLAFFFGSVFAGRWAERINVTRLLALGVALSLLGGASLPIIWWLGLLSPVTLTAGMAVVGLGLGPIFAVAPSIALEAFDEQAGMASAVIGAVEMVCAGIASTVVTVLHNGTPGPMVWSALLFVALSMVAWIWSNAGKRHSL
ncbi:MAG: multidrug effflux MFS transporter [Pseudomonadota bacterium]